MADPKVPPSTGLPKDDKTTSEGTLRTNVPPNEPNRPATTSKVDPALRDNPQMNPELQQRIAKERADRKESERSAADEIKERRKKAEEQQGTERASRKADPNPNDPLAQQEPEYKDPEKVVEEGKLQLTEEDKIRAREKGTDEEEARDEKEQKVMSIRLQTPEGGTSGPVTPRT